MPFHVDLTRFAPIVPIFAHLDAKGAAPEARDGCLAERGRRGGCSTSRCGRSTAGVDAEQARLPAASQRTDGLHCLRHRPHRRRGSARHMSAADLVNPLLRASAEPGPPGLPLWQSADVEFVLVDLCWPASPGRRPVRHARLQPRRASLRSVRADDRFNDLPGLPPWTV